jgi:hypothetical protein
MKTAVDAFERNLTPVVISDACGSHAGVDVHNAGLLILERFIGKDQIVTTVEFFRAYDNFVKKSKSESDSVGVARISTGTRAQYHIHITSVKNMRVQLSG